MKRKLLCLLLLLGALLVFSPVTYAAEGGGYTEVTDSAPSMADYYEQQSRDSGAEDLPNQLPEETRKTLEQLGISGADWNSMTSITPEALFSQVGSMAQTSAVRPLKAVGSVLAVILLCALLNGLKLSFGDRPLGGTIGMAGTLCICVMVIQPIVEVVSNAAQVIQGASAFLMACIPVLTAIMAAAGQPISAASYNLLMMAAGNTISLIAANVLVPFLSIYLAVSVVSAVSPGVNLNGICAMFSKFVKWALGLSMTVFSGLLTLHGIVSTSMDSTGTRAVRFLVSSFIPIVGGAIGEAMHTIGGCVKMLKAGVSAFGLLAGCMIFLPVLLECILWLLTLNLCAAVGDVFNLDQISGLLRAAANVMQTMVAILLCSMTILTVSTVVMLVIGGAGSS